MESMTEELEKAFAASPEALLLCDLSGRIIDANAPACALTGYERKDLLGIMLDDLSEPGAARLLPELRRISTLDLEAGVRCKDGSTPRFQLQLRPLRMGNDTHSMIRVARRRRAADRLLEDSDFIRTVLDAEGLIIFSVCAEGRLIYGNAGFEELTGLSFRQVRGRKVWDLVPDPAECASLRRVIEASEENPTVTVRWPIAGGSHRVLVCTQALLRPSSQRPGYRVLIGREEHAPLAYPQRTPSALSARKERGSVRLEQRVAQLTAQLESVHHEHDSLMYTLAHDLRAPLRAMSGFSDALLEEYADRPLDSQAKEYVQRIGDSAHRMNALIEGVMHYSQLSRMPLQLGTFQLDALLHEIVRRYTREIRTRNAYVTVEAQPQEIHSDRSIMSMLVSQLLSNALKFVQPEAEVRVVLRTERIEGGVRISVSDKGIGIPPEYHQTIFGMFQRLNPTETYLGTGMGLAIVGKAAERIKGKLGLKSEPGQGSTFWLDVPVVP